MHQGMHGAALQVILIGWFKEYSVSGDNDREK